jgi:hypothetical protein
VIGGVAARRARQAFAPESEVLAERLAVRGTLPRRGIVGDEIADALERRRFRMPEAAAGEAVARRDVEVKRRRGDFATALVEQARPGPWRS